MKLCRGETFQLPALLTIDVNDRNQIFGHSAIDDAIFIRVVDRRNGNVNQQMLSWCNDNYVSLLAHPTDAGFVLEGCASCEVIRNYNVQTEECVIVREGSIPIRMNSGPAGSILVLAFKEPNLCDIMELSRLNWENQQPILVPAQTWEIKKRLLGMSYVERHDILVCIYESEGVEAVKLDCELSAIWSLSGMVDGLPFKPDSVTCDDDGNAYVGDGTRNRIIKIDSSTGVVITVFQLVEENQMQIRSLFWSKNEPSLTVVRGHRISTFYIPQLD